MQTASCLAMCAPGLALGLPACLPAASIAISSRLRGLLLSSLSTGASEPRRSPTVASTPSLWPLATRDSRAAPASTSTSFIRRFASSSSSSDGPHELLASKCRVLPFILDRNNAEREWERHHSGLFTSRPGGWDSAKAVLLPYWCFSAEAQVHVQSAQVGHNRLVSRFNPATRRPETRWETVWSSVAPGWRYSRRWGSETPEAQVYGGAKYRHDPAVAADLKPREHVRRALPYHEYVRQAEAATAAAAGGGGGGAGRAAVVPDRMYPFRLGPTEAAEMAKKNIRASELRIAEEALLSAYSASSVRFVVLEVAFSRAAATPVFVPAYVFKSRIRGTPLRTYVAGFAAGLTSGPVLPNPTRVATVAATVAPLALLLGGGIGWQGALWFGAVLPAILSYGVASFWPEIHAGALRLRARLQRPLPPPGSAGGEEEAWWRHEWVRQDLDDDDAYGFGADARYDRTYSRSQQQQGPSSTAGGSSGGSGAAPRDPRGYYSTLGLSPGCSREEVQAAFRAAALRWHPDRQPDPARKAEATRRFQAAQEAYSVLRDPARRAAYDRA